jgi:hypothetical protein
MPGPGSASKDLLELGKRPTSELIRSLARRSRREKMLDHGGSRLVRLSLELRHHQRPRQSIAERYHFSAEVISLVL